MFEAATAVRRLASPSDNGNYIGYYVAAVCRSS